MDMVRLNLLLVEEWNIGNHIENVLRENGTEDQVLRIDRASTFEEAQAKNECNIYHMFLVKYGEDAQQFRKTLRSKGIAAPIVFLVGDSPLKAELAAMPLAEETMVFSVTDLTPGLISLLIRYARLFYRYGEMQRELAVPLQVAVGYPRQQFKEMSLFRDSLTGLYNRAYFLDRLAQLDTEGQRPLSLILGDMNGLTLINDAFGYGEGDRLLKEVSRALQDCCRKEDILARWSGDAFAVLLPKSTQKDALAVIDCAKASLAAVVADPVGPSVSFGCSTQEDESQDLHDLLQKAEMEMHRNKMSEGKEFCDVIIASLVHALGKKDYETEEHTWRMQDLAIKLGGAFGLSDSQFEDLVLAVTLHDVGKIAVPERILMKPGSLTDEEWDIIKGHSERGYRIALCSSELAHSASYILSHHERWDGKGYPQGLQQEEIPLISRIISVIDSYDVMVNGRPYKKGMDKQAAILELKRCAGSQFDPRLVEMFIKVLEMQDTGQS